MTEPTPRTEARVIQLRLIGQATLRSAEAAVLFRTGTRTIRPIEALLLSPILIRLARHGQPDPRFHQSGLAPERRGAAHTLTAA
jgi:hypothetical protein